MSLTKRLYDAIWYSILVITFSICNQVDKRYYRYKILPRYQIICCWFKDMWLKQLLTSSKHCTVHKYVGKDCYDVLNQVFVVWIRTPEWKLRVKPKKIFTIRMFLRSPYDYYGWEKSYYQLEDNSNITVDNTSACSEVLNQNWSERLEKFMFFIWFQKSFSGAILSSIMKIVWMLMVLSIMFHWYIAPSGREGSNRLNIIFSESLYMTLTLLSTFNMIFYRQG